MKSRVLFMRRLGAKPRAGAYCAMSSAPSPSFTDVTRYFDNDFPFDALASEETAFLARVTALPLPPDARARVHARAATAAWSTFHTRHAGAFFKPRHFITAAFPVLRDALHIHEVGCGSCSNVWPLLEKGHPASTIYASDVAPSALAFLASHPRFTEAAASGRLAPPFLWDGTRHGVGGGGVDGDDASSLPAPVPARVSGGGCDAALVTFVASALHPDDHAHLFANVAATLCPGGALCFRDYAVRDLAQLRAGAGNILTPQLHVRGDGTLAYFFELEEVRALLEGSGLCVEELRYACVENVNRREGVVMRRVWVHALARKPRGGGEL